MRKRALKTLKRNQYIATERKKYKKRQNALKKALKSVNCFFKSGSKQMTWV